MDDVVGLRLSLGGASVSPNREPEGGPPADLGGGVAREAEAQATAEADRSIDRCTEGCHESTLDDPGPGVAVDRDAREVELIAGLHRHASLMACPTASGGNGAKRRRQEAR